MLYVVPQYAADMVTLIARLDVESVDWLGTSMGGLIGMALASLSGNPLRKLVLNDAGPVVSHAALERIGAYVGLRPVFPTPRQKVKNRLGPEVQPELQGNVLEGPPLSEKAGDEISVHHQPPREELHQNIWTFVEAQISLKAETLPETKRYSTPLSAASLLPKAVRLLRGDSWMRGRRL